MALSALVPLAQAAEPGPPDAWSISADVLADRQFETAMDGGGEVSVDQLALRLGASRSVAPGTRLGLQLGLGELDYRFEPPGDNPSAEAPWSNVQTAQIGITFNTRLGERWRAFAIPTMNWAAENGTDLGEGGYGGVLAAATYRFNDRLSIGPGIGAFSEIEGGASVFPILALDWRISDTLALRTGGGLAATRGPGLTLEWSPSGPWSFGLGARWEELRFRLDDRGPAPDGVGQDRSIPIYLRATRELGPNASFSLILGAKTGGNLRLEDRDGDKIEDWDYDTAPFAGGALTFRL
jgi:hypothetical protein